MLGVIHWGLREMVYSDPELSTVAELQFAKGRANVEFAAGQYRMAYEGYTKIINGDSRCRPFYTRPFQRRGVPAHARGLPFW